MEKISENRPPGLRKPGINYPCLWQYTVITMDRNALYTAVAEHLGEATARLSENRTSSGGRYVSMNLELIVNSDGHRLRLSQFLAALPAVKVVL